MTTFDFFKKYVAMLLLTLLAAMIIIGVMTYFLMLKNQDVAISLMQSFSDMVNEKGIIDDNGDISLFALFLNNFKATVTAVILGVLPFLFLPAFVIISNGMMTGAIFALVGINGQNVLLYIAAGILPHGIFEIPAVCLGVALGLVLCRFECSHIRGKGELANMPVSDFIIHIIKIFTCVATPLLVIAAVVETYLTPVLLNMVL